MREAPTPTNPTAVAPVDAALAECSQDVGYVIKQLHALEDRLARVLAPVPPAAGDVAKAMVKPEPFRIAERIAEIGTSARLAGARIGSLIDRLEI